MFVILFVYREDCETRGPSRQIKVPYTLRWVRMVQ